VLCCCGSYWWEIFTDFSSFDFELSQLGRSWWALARDNATPFSEYFIEVSVKLSCPVRSTLLCCMVSKHFQSQWSHWYLAFTQLFFALALALFS
jgi:hypothetical protein